MLLCNYNLAMTFTQLLSAAQRTNNSLLCVGLDPDLAKLPTHLQGKPDAVFEFLCRYCRRHCRFGV